MCAAHFHATVIVIAAGAVKFVPASKSKFIVCPAIMVAGVVKVKGVLNVEYPEPVFQLTVAV